MELSCLFPFFFLLSFFFSFRVQLHRKKGRNEQNSSTDVKTRLPPGSSPFGTLCVHCRDPDDDASVDTVSWTRCGISSSVLQARRRWSGNQDPTHGGCGIWPLGTLVTRRHNPLLLLFLRAAEAVVLRNWRHRSTEVVSFVADRQDKCRPRCRCTNYSWLFLWPSLQWRGPGEMGRGRGGCWKGEGVFGGPRQRKVGVRKSRKKWSGERIGDCCWPRRDEEEGGGAGLSRLRGLIVLLLSLFLNSCFFGHWQCDLVPHRCWNEQAADYISVIPSLISLMVSVDVKHHVYLLTT